MSEKKQCPKCGSLVFHNKGVSKKTNKPYENYKCGSCDYIKWVDLTGGGEGFKKAVPANNEEVMKALREIYKLIDALREDFKIFTDAFAGDNQETPKVSQQELKNVYDSDEERWN